MTCDKTVVMLFIQSLPESPATEVPHPAPYIEEVQVRLGVLAARIVMLCMTFFFCAPLQSAGGFILEGDWTPTKMNLFYSPPIEVGVLSPFKIISAILPDQGCIAFSQSKKECLKIRHPFYVP